MNLAGDRHNDVSPSEGVVAAQLTQPATTSFDSSHAWTIPPVQTLLICACVILAAGSFAYAAFNDTLFSLSVDLATHMSMGRAMQDGFLLSEADKMALGPMYFYPNFSHAIAALLWKMGVDPINAFNLVGIAAVITSWIVLAVLVARTSFTGFTIFITLSLALIVTIKPAVLVGGEILLNFFYAQVVGDAAFLICAVLGWSIARRHGVVALLGFAIFSVFFLAQFHLLPALRIALVFAGLAAAVGLQAIIAKQMREALIAGASVVAILLTFVLNPTYLFMTKIAENDGSLSFGLELSISAITVLSAAVLAVAVAGVLLGIFVWRQRPATGSEISSMRVWNAHWVDGTGLLYVIAGATAAAALAQSFQFLVVHAGSGYAVRKHLFGLTTYGLAALTCLTGSWLDGWFKVRPRQGIGVMEAGLVSGFAVGIAFFQNSSALDVKRLIEVSNAVEEINATGSGQLGKPIFLSSSYPIPVNYLVSVAILYSPQVPDPNTLALLQGKPIPNWNAVSSIVTLEGDKSFDVAECRTAAPLAGVVMVDSVCFMEKGTVAAELELGGELSFATGGAAWRLTSGWWTAESWGTWSIGNKAIIDIPTAGEIPETPLRVEVDVNGFVVPSSPTRSIAVSVNNGPPVPFVLTMNAPSQTIAIPIDGRSIRAAGGVHIVFEVVDPASPKELGLSVDDRMMGVGIKKIRLVQAATTTPN